MSEISDNTERAELDSGDVKCRLETSRALDDGPPSGERENPLIACKHPASNPPPVDVEHLERKKKTRRRKPKRKNPYNKQITEHRIHKPIGKRIYACKQPVAPYNSNQFLIEDHNDLQDFDVKLLAVSAAANKSCLETQPPSISGLDPARPPRLRDSSFTSADSDEDFFYSSPEDEEEFLTKEFSNTYQDLHFESLTQMTKTELIQHVLQLEEKVDSLEKRLEAGKIRPERTRENDSGGEVGLVDKILKFQQKISTLELANEELQHENEKLRRQKKCSSVSSVDSESDSSTSSGSSEMSDNDDSGECTEIKNGSLTPHRLMNGNDCIVDNDCSMDTDSAR